MKIFCHSSLGRRHHHFVNPPSCTRARGIFKTKILDPIQQVPALRAVHDHDARADHGWISERRFGPEGVFEGETTLRIEPGA